MGWGGGSSQRKMNERKEKCTHVINSFPRHMLKVKHRGGEQREVTHDRNTNANWTGKMDLEGWRRVCKRQLVKWRQRWRKW